MFWCVSSHLTIKYWTRSSLGFTIFREIFFADFVKIRISIILIQNQRKNQKKNQDFSLLINFVERKKRHEISQKKNREKKILLKRLSLWSPRFICQRVLCLIELFIFTYLFIKPDICIICELRGAAGVPIYRRLRAQMYVQKKRNGKSSFLVVYRFLF